MARVRPTASFPARLGLGLAFALAALPGCGGKPADVDTAEVAPDPTAKPAPSPPAAPISGSPADAPPKN